MLHGLRYHALLLTARVLVAAAEHADTCAIEAELRGMDTHADRMDRLADWLDDAAVLVGGRACAAADRAACATTMVAYRLAGAAESDAVMGWALGRHARAAFLCSERHGAVYHLLQGLPL